MNVRLQAIYFNEPTIPLTEWYSTTVTYLIYNNHYHAAYCMYVPPTTATALSSYKNCKSSMNFPAASFTTSQYPNPGTIHNLL